MDIHHYIGIDISKATLDWAVFDGKTIQWQTTTANTVAGIKIALPGLKAIPDWKPLQAIFCMEHRGIYNAHLLEFLHKASLSIWLENSSQIKLAGGMQRGKNDVMWSMPNGLPNTPARAAPYRFRDQLRLWEPPRQIIQPHGRPRTFLLKRSPSATYSGGTGRPAIISWLDH